jgi:hypothetical protein
VAGAIQRRVQIDGLTSLMLRCGASDEAVDLFVRLLEDVATAHHGERDRQAMRDALVAEVLAILRSFHDLDASAATDGRGAYNAQTVRARVHRGQRATSVP